MTFRTELPARSLSSRAELGWLKFKNQHPAVAAYINKGRTWLEGGDQRTALGLAPLTANGAPSADRTRDVQLRQQVLNTNNVFTTGSSAGSAGSVFKATPATSIDSNRITLAANVLKAYTSTRIRNICLGVGVIVEGIAALTPALTSMANTLWFAADGSVWGSVNSTLAVASNLLVGLIPLGIYGISRFVSQKKLIKFAQEDPNALAEKLRGLPEKEQTKILNLLVEAKADIKPVVNACDFIAEGNFTLAAIDLQIDALESFLKTKGVTRGFTRQRLNTLGKLEEIKLTIAGLAINDYNGRDKSGPLDTAKFNQNDIKALITSLGNISTASDVRSEAQSAVTLLEAIRVEAANIKKASDFIAAYREAEKKGAVDPIRSQTEAVALAGELIKIDPELFEAKELGNIILDLGKAKPKPPSSSEISVILNIDLSTLTGLAGLKQTIEYFRTLAGALASAPLEEKTAITAKIKELRMALEASVSGYNIGIVEGDDNSGGPARKFLVLPQEGPKSTGIKYQGGRVLGKGGFGEVYLVMDLDGGKNYAAKFNLDPENADISRRFEEESKAMMGIKHDGVVKVVASKGRYHFIMEYMDPKEGWSRLDDKNYKRIHPDKGLSILVKITHILEAIKIYHRDLKSSNIFIRETADGSDEIKILDFGLVLDPSSGSKETATGMAAGTAPTSLPAYLALYPRLGSGELNEQQRNQKNYLLRLNDQFGLGAIGYGLLTGHYPVYQGEGGKPFRLSAENKGKATDIRTLTELILDFGRLQNAKDANPPNTATIDNLRNIYKLVGTIAGITIPGPILAILRELICFDPDLNKYKSILEVRQKLEKIAAELSAGPAGDPTAPGEKGPDDQGEKTRLLAETKLNFSDRKEVLGFLASANSVLIDGDVAIDQERVDAILAKCLAVLEAFPNDAAIKRQANNVVAEIETRTD